MKLVNELLVDGGPPIGSPWSIRTPRNPQASGLAIAAASGTMNGILQGHGVTHDFEAYKGDHVNRIAGRLGTHVMPFFTQHLETDQHVLRTRFSDTLKSGVEKATKVLSAQKA